MAGLLEWHPRRFQVKTASFGQCRRGQTEWEVESYLRRSTIMEVWNVAYDIRDTLPWKLIAFTCVD